MYMKKIPFLVFILALTTSMLAQNTKRAMRVFYNGEIVRSLDASKIDSMNLHFTEVTENDTYYIWVSDNAGNISAAKI